MPKDAYWFRHDSNAGRDIKMLTLKHIYGHWSSGIFWEVIEFLREQPEYRFSSKESDLQLLSGVIGCADYTKFMNWFKDAVRLELLVNKNGVFYSESLCYRMKKWETSKENGSKSTGNKEPKHTESIPKAYRTSKQKHNIREEENRVEESIGDLNNDAEVVVLGNEIEFEKICMATNTKTEKAKKRLHSYHLWLIEQKKYPYSRKQCFAGFERWLITGNDFGINGKQSGSKIPTMFAPPKDQM